MIPESISSDPGLRLFCGLALGLLAGSFLATLVLRWPAGRSVVVGRSRCDHCTGTLEPAELVPVLSFVLQRGRCRRCDGPIDRHHPVLELLAAAIGAASFVAHQGWPGAVGALAGWLLLTLAALDLAHLWLPDRLTLPLAALGLLASALTGQPAFTESLVGAVAGWGSLAMVAAVYRGLRGRTGLGGGDPKLFAAIGAWLGWRSLPIVLLLAAILGLGAALALAWRGREITRATELPFGALLAAAAWPIWLAGLQP